MEPVDCPSATAALQMKNVAARAGRDLRMIGSPPVWKPFRDDRRIPVRLVGTRWRGKEPAGGNPQAARSRCPLSAVNKSSSTCLSLRARGGAKGTAEKHMSFSLHDLEQRVSQRA